MKPFIKISRLGKFYRDTYHYRRVFGSITGVLLGLKLRHGYWGAEGSVFSLALPGYRAPIHLRSRSVDGRVFYEVFGEQPLCIEFESPPRFVIDAGAHIGLHSVYLAHRFPEARVYALEVAESNYRLLKRNTTCYENIVTLRKGLWPRKTRLRIVDTSVDTWAFSVSETAENGDETIPGVGVEDIMKECGIDEIDLLKIDIEGAERELFTLNYEPWIDKIRVFAIEFHDYIKAGCSDAVEKAIEGRNLKRLQHGDYLILMRR